MGAPATGLGSAQGSVYVFERQGGAWVETGKLVPSDPFTWALGWSVDLQGDRALIGAQGVVAFGDGSGRAFVFERTESGWVEVANLLPSIQKVGDGYGSSVALDGDRALIGAPHHNTFSTPYEGLAFVFDRQPGGGWTEQAVLSPPELEDADLFGRGVAVQGDRVLVGAPNHDLPVPGAGGVFVFDLVAGSWTQTGKIDSSDLSPNLFGWSVGLEGAHVVVGARSDDTLGANLGAAYLFQDDGTGWSEVSKFYASGLIPGDAFGTSVDIAGSEIVIGAPNGVSPGGGIGNAFLFHLSPGAYLTGDAETVSVSGGGTQELQLGACLEHAGDTFRIGGTFSGTSPGFLYQGFLVPLNPDPYFFYTLASPGIPLRPTSGTFDAWGRAYASFTVPPGSPPVLVGLELHHAYGVLDAATLQVELVSAPVPVALLP